MGLPAGREMNLLPYIFLESFKDSNSCSLGQPEGHYKIDMTWSVL
jgi:hypothetical protein